VQRARTHYPLCEELVEVIVYNLLCLKREAQGGVEVRMKGF
jgi:hypothetical protein